MARIAGVDLPNKKRMEYALTYIFGIGLHHSRLILTATGVDFNKRAFELTEDEAALIRKEIQENYLVEGDLRTKNNSRTRKGKKKTVANKKKATK